MFALFIIWCSVYFHQETAERKEVANSLSLVCIFPFITCLVIHFASFKWLKAVKLMTILCMVSNLLTTLHAFAILKDNAELNEYDLVMFQLMTAMLYFLNLAFLAFDFWLSFHSRFWIPCCIILWLEFAKLNLEQGSSTFMYPFVVWLVVGFLFEVSYYFVATCKTELFQQGLNIKLAGVKFQELLDKQDSGIVIFSKANEESP